MIGEQARAGHIPTTPLPAAPSYVGPLALLVGVAAAGGGVALTLATCAELVRTLAETAGPIGGGLGISVALRRKGGTK